MDYFLFLKHDLGRREVSSSIREEFKKLATEENATKFSSIQAANDFLIERMRNSVTDYLILYFNQLCLNNRMNPADRATKLRTVLEQLTAKYPGRVVEMLYMHAVYASLELYGMKVEVDQWINARGSSLSQVPFGVFEDYSKKKLQAAAQVHAARKQRTTRKSKKERVRSEYQALKSNNKRIRMQYRKFI